MNDKLQSNNLGSVTSVRGSVVDVRFDAHLPAIYNLLHANEDKISIEVLAHLDEKQIRGIALTPTQGLSRGQTVKDTGGPLKAPVGPEILSRMFDVSGNAIDRGPDLKNIEWRAALVPNFRNVRQNKKYLKLELRPLMFFSTRTWR